MPVSMSKSASSGHPTDSIPNRTPRWTPPGPILDISPDLTAHHPRPPRFHVTPTRPWPTLIPSSAPPAVDRSAQDRREQRPGHRDPLQLECQGLGMRDHLGPDLDQLLPQCRQARVLHLAWQRQLPQEVSAPGTARRRDSGRRRPRTARRSSRRAFESASTKTSRVGPDGAGRSPPRDAHGIRADRSSRLKPPPEWATPRARRRGGRARLLMGFRRAERWAKDGVGPWSPKRPPSVSAVEQGGRPGDDVARWHHHRPPLT
jgi:hypothetical protein